MLNTMRGGAAAQRHPRFAVGQVIHHTRYGYRGLIVAMDPTCQADEAWHEKNQTQPRRDQPWYHVLVNGSGSVTYVAQTSIEPDASGLPVDHPLVDEFFDRYQGGRYRRNGAPWRGW